MSKMIDEILAAGVKVKHYRAGNQKVKCPRCAHTRTNKSDTSLSITINPGEENCVWNCHYCGWSGNGGTVTRETSPALNTAHKKEYKTPEVAAGQYTDKFPAEVMAYLKTRGMTEEVLAKNKVCFEAERNAICFPYFETPDVAGKRRIPVNVKHRTWKGEKRMWSESGARAIFYGYDQILQADEIIICEGEYDKLSLNVAGFWNVVSVPMGAPSKEIEEERSAKFEFLFHAEELLKRVKKIIIAADNDKNGKILEKEIARRVGLEKCYVVKWPDGHKDANEVLVGLGVDMVCDCIQEAHPYPIEGLYSVEDFQGQLMDYYNTEMRRGELTGWTNVDTLYTVMPGEVTVVTGIPNSGKSEWLDALTVNLAKYSDWKFGIFSPENGKEIHVGKLTEKIMEQTLYPKAHDRMSEADYVTGIGWVARRYYFIIADNMEQLPTLEWIMEKARIAVFRYGVKGLVIDPYNEIEKKLNGAQETEYVSQMLSKLKKFAKANGVHIWIVAHPAKLQKDKDGKIQVPSGYDISGSAHWVNKADCLIVVHRSGAPDITEIHVKKIRFKHVGKQGAVNLLYDRKTGTYSTPQTEEFITDQQQETQTRTRTRKKAAPETKTFWEKEDDEVKSY